VDPFVESGRSDRRPRGRFQRRTHCRTDHCWFFEQTSRTRSDSIGDDWFFTKATGSGYLVDGHRYLAHTGVQPEVEVWLERDDVVEGKDTVVGAAIRWIESRAPRRSIGRRTP